MSEPARYLKGHFCRDEMQNTCWVYDLNSEVHEGHDIPASDQTNGKNEFFLGDTLQMYSQRLF